jgi:hypothetical protein
MRTTALWIVLGGCSVAPVEQEPRGGADPGLVADEDVVDPAQPLTWHADVDRDGLGAPDVLVASEADGAVNNGLDCDDADPEVGELLWVEDGDGDGYGAGPEVSSCTPPSGSFVSQDGDCGDADPDVHPGAPDRCGDGVDHDCDGYDDTVLDPAFAGPPGSCFDTDRDGLPDTREPDFDADPRLVDTDGDSLPDGAEALMLGSDPASAADAACMPWREMPTAAFRPYGLWLLDLDGDGWDDLLAEDLSGGRVLWMPGRGDGTFDPEESLSSIGEGGPSSAHADFEGDGDVDIASIASLFGEDNVVLSLNLGGGAFHAASRRLHGYSSPSFADPADLDDDGDPDLVLYSHFDDVVLLYENLGSSFEGPREILHVSSPLAITTGDLDGDGDADLVATRGWPTGIVWYENLGGATFGEGQTLAEFVAPNHLLTADLDEDGDLDLLTRDYAAVTWYENVGARFTPSWSAPLEPTGPVHVDDVDGDGDLDLLAAGDRLVWYENLGGTFGPEQLIRGVGDPVTGIATADIDGDGTLDVCSGGSGDHVSELSCFIQGIGDHDGDGLRNDAEVCVAHTDPYAADTDGDGLDDLRELLMLTDPTVP